MAPFLSFTAEEAWKVFGRQARPRRDHLHRDLPGPVGVAHDDALLAKWTRLREIRDAVNKAIEAVRARRPHRLVAAGRGRAVGLNAEDLALLGSLGDDLKFVLITSAATVRAGAGELSITVTPSKHQKCERCWHYRADVGINPAHPTICGRCDSNLHGEGEQRSIA